MKNISRTGYTLYVFLLLFSSCLTEQKCAERFPPKETIIYNTHDSIICITDTIRIPFNEVSIDTSGVVPFNISFHETVKKNGLTETINISKGKITAICHEDSVMEVLQHERKFKITNKEETKFYPKYIDHWYEPAALWIAGSYLLLTLILIIIKIAGMIAK